MSYLKRHNLAPAYSSNYLLVSFPPQCLSVFQFSLFFYLLVYVTPSGTYTLCLKDLHPPVSPFREVSSANSRSVHSRGMTVSWPGGRWRSRMLPMEVLSLLPFTSQFLTYLPNSTLNLGCVCFGNRLNF